MITNNDQVLSQNADTTPMEIITEKIKSLDDSVTQVRAQVTTCFGDLINALKTRETQLLRQIEVVHRQQLSVVQSNWEILCSAPSIAVNLNDGSDIIESILKLGKVELSDKDSIAVKDVEPYKVQEYEDALKDHISFEKSIRIEGNLTDAELPKDTSSKLIKLRDVNTSTEYTNNNNESRQGYDEHPEQIQQWLQQILIESETEPTPQEIEKFVEISKSRYRGFQFSLET